MLISLHWLCIAEASPHTGSPDVPSIHGTSPKSTACSTVYSQQTGVPSCQCQHVERPSNPHHICTVTCGHQTASQDFPLLSFLPRHPDMTYLSLLIIIIVFSFFSGISRGPCNNWHYLGHVKHADDDTFIYILFHLYIYTVVVLASFVVGLFKCQNGQYSSDVVTSIHACSLLSSSSSAW